MIYGYFYINVYKNPNIQWINVNHMIDITKDYFYKTHNVDRIIYDYKSKPSNQDYQKLSGYVFNENYISKEIRKYITSCNRN